ncbi:MAG: hypothetical protein ABEI74_02690 [Candidatus Pacearchaeota archaeon]
MQDSGLVIRGLDHEALPGKYLALGIVDPEEKPAAGLNYPTGIIGPHNFEEMDHFYLNQQRSNYKLLRSAPDFVENKVAYDFKHKQSEGKGWSVEVYNFRRNLPKDMNYEMLDFSEYLDGQNPFSRNSGVRILGFMPSFD